MQVIKLLNMYPSQPASSGERGMEEGKLICETIVEIFFDFVLNLSEDITFR